MKQNEDLAYTNESNKNDHTTHQKYHQESHGAQTPILRAQNSKSLCEMCQNIFDHWYQIPTTAYADKSFPFYNNTSSMKLAAIAGCLLCGQFLQILEFEGIWQDVHMSRGAVVEALYSSSASWIIRLYCNNGKTPKIKVWPTELDTAVPGILHERDGENALPKVHQWLKDCMKGHKICRLLEEEFLPTRLIYLEHGVSRIVLSETVKGFPKYATLSHCWGSADYLTLSHQNLKHFMEKIPQEALPRTFAEAIEVARSLGIHYLWIDSLCIIQDKDSEDWSRESSQMTKVYGSSSLNIGATAAVDSHQGLFHERSTHRNTSFSMVAKTNGKDNVLWYCWPDNLYEYSISASPLAQRGWVLQERLLAPRSVHFTNSQVFWECNETAAWEAFVTAGNPEKKLLEANSWDQIVGQYSRCQLTFGTDKLVAIAGIARAMHMHLQEDYLAGLWGGYDLVRQLLWYCLIPLLTRPFEYRGPTWSWSSVDSRVEFKKQFPIGRCAIHVQVLDKEIELSGLDRFGAVSYARLLLRCDMLYPVDGKVLENQKPFSTDIGGAGVRISIKFDFPDEQNGTLYLVPFVSTLDRSANIPNAHFQHVYAMESFRNADGLVLKLTNSVRGEYRRVGSFHFTAFERDWSPRTQIENGEGPLPTYAYKDITQVETDGTAKYTIDII